MALLLAGMSSCQGNESQASNDSENTSATHHQSSNEPEITNEPVAGITPNGEKELVIIGYQQDSSLSTLGIMIDEKGGVTLTKTLDYLVTPKKTGFWYMQLASTRSVEYLTNDWGEEGMIPNYRKTDFIYMAQSVNDLKEKLHRHKINLSEEKPEVIADREYNEETGLNIKYVTNKYISFTSWYSGYTGGAHPNHGNNAHTYHFDDFISHLKNTYTFSSWNRLEGKQVNFKSCYSDDVWNKLIVSLEEQGRTGRFADLMNDEPVNPREVDLNNIVAILEHKEGAVHPVYEAYADAAYAESRDYYFTADYHSAGPVCDEEVPFNQVPDAVHDFVSKLNCLDFLVSPGRNAVVLLHADKIDVVSLHTGEVTGSFPLKNYRLIMAEWAMGDFSEKWTSQLFR